MAKQRTPYDSEVSKKKKIHGMMEKCPSPLTPKSELAVTVAEHLKRRKSMANLQR